MSLLKRVLRRPREAKDVEQPLVAFARARGWAAMKIDHDGWPDRVFALPGGVNVYAEFKRPGGEPTPLQRERIAQLRALGHAVHVVDDYDAGVDLLRRAAGVGA